MGESARQGEVFDIVDMHAPVLSEVQQAARAVHRRGALCRERCPRGSSGLEKMDEMN